MQLQYQSQCGVMTGAVTLMTSMTSVKIIQAINSVALQSPLLTVS